jgi:hypothetical protein
LATVQPLYTFQTKPLLSIALVFCDNDINFFQVVAEDAGRIYKQILEGQQREAVSTAGGRGAAAEQEAPNASPEELSVRLRAWTQVHHLPIPAISRLTVSIMRCHQERVLSQVQFLPVALGVADDALVDLQPDR